MGSTPENLAGQTFERLHVLRQVGRTKHGSVRWKCRCSCGNTTIVSAGDLKSRHTMSCGCRRREVSAARQRTHGESGTRVGLPASSEYKTWASIIQRCTNLNNPNYKNYGGRGITVCKHWMKFENFLADMGRRPSSKHTIERKDNEGPYSQENCTWATMLEQGNNKRSNHLITFKGETQTLSEWARRTGINQTTIRSRLDRLGWSTEKALTIPTRARRR